MKDAHGFLGSLLDLSFTEFVTTKVLRLIYVAVAVGLALWAVVLLVAALSAGTLMALGGLVVVPIGLIVAVTLLRIWCELVIVAFRIADHVAETADQAAAIAVNTRSTTRSES